jgi:diguanylate cyclase (GGDEF)-like protein
MLFSKKRDITLQKEAALAREKAATTDVLTGLGNRRFADERLATDFQRARRYGEPLSVLLMDIDHFKNVNDTYGHDVGDKVLEHFGRMLSDHARTTDAVARWGGEEFIMIAPQTDIDGALLAANRICESVRKQAVIFGTADIAYTVSIGVAQLIDQRTIAELVASADQELYRAKRAGRDRALAHVPAPIAKLDFLPQRTQRM